MLFEAEGGGPAKLLSKFDKFEYTWSKTTKSKSLGKDIFAVEVQPKKVQ